MDQSPDGAATVGWYGVNIADMREGKRISRHGVYARRRSDVLRSRKVFLEHVARSGVGG